MLWRRYAEADAQAENGKEGLRKFKRHPYDAVLMDCEMPIMDGFEATRKIRLYEASQGLSAVPIIALTGNAMLANKERCLAVGMTDFLAKPVTRATLGQVLGKVVFALI